MAFKTRINGLGNGVVVPFSESEQYEVGDTYRHNGEDYTITHKESLRKYTDGRYDQSVVFLLLRGLEV